MHLFQINSTLTTNISSGRKEWDMVVFALHAAGHWIDHTKWTIDYMSDGP